MNTNKIKILMYIPTLLGGGAERVFLDLANYFSSKDIEVILFTYNSGVYKDLLSDKVKHIYTSKPNKFFIRIFYSIFTLLKILRKERPSCLFTNLTEANVIGFFCLKAIRGNIKFVSRQAHVLEQSVLKDSDIKGKIFNKLNKVAYNNSDLVIANSKDTLKSLKDIYKLKNNVLFIPNPISFPDNKRREFNDFKFDEKYKYIISVGRLTKVKDHETLINSFRLVYNKNKNYRLLILGEGVEKNNLVKMVKDLGLEDSVFFTGFVKNPFEYYKRSSLFALSSIQEGFGNVLVEALACGLPVVSTNCSGGPNYILQNGQYGSLVKVGDYQDMANNIVKELKNDSSLLRLKRIERARFFSLENIGPQYLGAINKVL